MTNYIVFQIVSQKVTLEGKFELDDKRIVNMANQIDHFIAINTFMLSYYKQDDSSQLLKKRTSQTSLAIQSQDF